MHSISSQPLVRTRSPRPPVHPSLHGEQRSSYERQASASLAAPVTPIHSLSAEDVHESTSPSTHAKALSQVSARGEATPQPNSGGCDSHDASSESHVSA